MPCSCVNTAWRIGDADAPSVAQSPTRTLTIGSPASKPSSTSRNAAGTGFEV